MEVTAEEILEYVKRMFPREFDLACAQLSIDRLSARVAELEAQVGGVGADGHS